MELFLNNIEYREILEYVEIPFNLKVLINGNNIIIRGNKEFFKELLDNLSSCLMEAGIDEKGEINYIGYDIERIIDKLSVIYDRE